MCVCVCGCVYRYRHACSHTHTRARARSRAHTHTHRYKCIFAKVAFAGPGAAGPTKLTAHRSFIDRDADDALADDITLREAGLLK